jgi:hypothetical protein
LAWRFYEVIARIAALAGRCLLLPVRQGGSMVDQRRPVPLARRSARGR